MKQARRDVIDVKQVKGNVIDVHKQPIEEIFLCLEECLHVADLDVSMQAVSKFDVSDTRLAG